MSRHRGLRKLDFDEDDFHEEEEVPSLEPSPETAEMYLYRYHEMTGRGTTPALENWMVPRGVEEGALTRALEASRIDAEDKEDHALLREAADEIRKVLGDGFSDEDVNRALLATEYDPERAIGVLLDSREFPGHVEEDREVTTEGRVRERENGEPSRVFDLLDEHEWKIGQNPVVDDRVFEDHILALAREMGDHDSIFQFDTPSPDDVVLGKQATSKLSSSAKVTSTPSREGNAVATSDVKHVVVKKTPSKTTQQRAIPAQQNSSSSTASPANRKEEGLRVPQRAKKLDISPYIKDEIAPVTLVVAGHVDAGKSTLVGQLLRGVDGARAKPRADLSLAWTSDVDGLERERGVTIDSGIHSFVMPTSHRLITLVDSPGHRDFVPAMINGASQASGALLVIDSSPGEFEAGFSELGQTREHTILLKGLGIQRLLVVVNKLDMVDFDEARFFEVRSLLSDFLRQAGFKEDVAFVPCSGSTGLNVSCEPPENHPLATWYRDSSLLGALESLAGASDSSVLNAPFCLAASDVTKVQNFGTVTVNGKIIQGNLALNDQILVLPAGELAQVKGIESGGRRVEVALANRGLISVGLQGDLDASIMLPGTVLCDPEHPVQLTIRFTGQVVTLPSLTTPIIQGQRVILHIGSGSETATISRLLEVVDRRNVSGSSADLSTTSTQQRKRPRCLTKNQSARIEISTSRPIPLHRYQDVRELGRFVLRNQGQTLAVGIVTEFQQFQGPK